MTRVCCLFKGVKEASFQDKGPEEIDKNVINVHLYLRMQQISVDAAEAMEFCELQRPDI